MSTSLKYVSHDLYDRKKFIALSALLFVVIVRIGFYLPVLVRPDLSIFPDSGDYQRISDRLLSLTAYAWKTDNPEELWRTVGYPLFLAAISFFGGDETFKVAVVQLVLSGLLALFVFFYLYRSLEYFQAFLAALLMLVDPLSILFVFDDIKRNLVHFYSIHCFCLYCPLGGDKTTQLPYSGRSVFGGGMPGKAHWSIDGCYWARHDLVVS